MESLYARRRALLPLAGTDPAPRTLLDRLDLASDVLHDRSHADLQLGPYSANGSASCRRISAAAPARPSFDLASLSHSRALVLFFFSRILPTGWDPQSIRMGAVHRAPFDKDCLFRRLSMVQLAFSGRTDRTALPVLLVRRPFAFSARILRGHCRFPLGSPPQPAGPATLLVEVCRAHRRRRRDGRAGLRPLSGERPLFLSRPHGRRSGRSCESHHAAA